jgi:hypothetical protein
MTGYFMQVQIISGEFMLGEYFQVISGVVRLNQAKTA